MATQTESRDNLAFDNEEPFHLVIREGDGGPTTWVGICVNEGLRAYINDRSILEPHMLTVVTHQGREMSRHLTPLTNGVVHLSFRRAGEHKVYATIVWKEKGAHRSLKGAVMHRSGRGYSLRLLNWDKDGLDTELEWYEAKPKDNRLNRVMRHPHESVATIVIADGHFAKPRAQWRETHQSWYNYGDARDECHFRQRDIAAWLRSLTLLPLHYFIKLVGVTLALGTGFCYGLDVKAATRPMRTGSLPSTFGNVDAANFWIMKRRTYPSGGYTYDYRPWYVLLIGVAVIIGGLTLLLGPAPLLKPGIFLVTLFTLFALIIGVIELIIRFNKRKSGEEYKARKRAQKDERDRDELGRLNSQLDAMSCDVQGEPMSVQKLLERHPKKPVVLYHQLKDEIVGCKPFES